MAYPGEFVIPRRSVEGDEGEWCKMFDPPTANPDTPELLAPTNPVPEVMAAAGLQSPPSRPHTCRRDLMHGLSIPTWDGLKNLEFYVFRDGDNPAADGNFPAATIRVPRGAIFHCQTSGHGPPPHTIHWHGIEPTAMNDGVGHCSMEIGNYIYQWQPNFIGTYFYHCHRNTMQHFEFGLYGLLIVETPDAYFATLQDPAVPIGAGRDGLRRTAANLGPSAANPAGFPQFPGFNGAALDEDDPLGEYPTHPHAMTVPYDVEAFWVLDDRDSVWSELGDDPHATFPAHGDQPGVNDEFQRRPGRDRGEGAFFAFNDFHPDYFFVTGVPVPAHVYGGGGIAPDLVIPAELNSGVSGTQVSITAHPDQTVLVRCLDAAYAKTRITFPVDVVVIAWDGRALGVPPFAGYNRPFVIPAGTPYTISTARRFDALFRTSELMEDFATVEFLDTRGDDVLFTARIPIRVIPAPTTVSVSGRVADSLGAAKAGVTITVTGPVTRTTLTDANGNYTVAGLDSGIYTITPTLDQHAFAPPERIEELHAHPYGGLGNPGGNRVGLNFTAIFAPTVFAASGVVTDGNGAPLAGVAVTASTAGAADRTVVTDPFGAFTLAGLPSAVYTITPALAGTTFTPPTRTIAISGADVPGLHFVGAAEVPVQTTFSVSGMVKRSGRGVGGVLLTLRGPVARKVKTDARGRFALTGLPNGTYRLSPSKLGLVFDPRVRVVTVAGADVTGRGFRVVGRK